MSNLEKWCPKCWSLFSTLESLKALCSDEGYEHHSWRDINNGANRGCPLCAIIVDSRVGIGASPAHHLKNCLRLRATCGPGSGTKAYSNYPFKVLDVRYISAIHSSTGVESNLLATYSPPGGPSADLLHSLPFYYAMAGDLHIEEAKRRLEDCCKTHQSCGSKDLPSLPRRVIDVGGTAKSPNPKLHISSIHEKDHYAALSYCWGSEPQTTTTLETLQAKEERIEFESLSQSIQDAITITRKLGIKYLWVDALCILQHNSVDIAREIDGMGKIYQNATLTIAAANSESASSGFLNAKHQHRGTELPFYHPDGTLGQIIIVPCGTNHPALFAWPLDSRAWALQEHLLSTRLLVFANGEVRWQCQTTVMEPLITSPVRYPPFSQRTPRLPTACQETLKDMELQTDRQDFNQRDTWWRIVRAYSSRELSIPEDRLPAIAGIAAHLQVVWNDKFLAGLWRNCFLDHLVWFIKTPDVVPPDFPYIAPSWSWISVNGPLRLSLSISMACEFRECVLEPLDSNAQLGRLGSGCLTLFGAVLPNPKFIGPSYMDHFSGKHTKEFDTFLEDVVFLRIGHETYVPNQAPHSMVKNQLWPPTKSVVGLLLKPVDAGTFKRVGLFNQSDPDNRWDSAEEKVVRII